ncbi:nucleoid-associated protein [Alkalithermobacter paradoxus]|uniref:37-kD nucleoid-associated bacterial protein n=1 Tax=Alkalithermobacter paradoxus TaxID=29349 RepID=A0A1V4I921_9FIRM|nr:37-kD nucleoid-associated bacterial protein [[Clostridium] thermoalcaliphilum]
MQIHKFIIHILDKNNPTPILNDFEGEINEQVHEFFEKHIYRAIRDDNNKKAKFVDSQSDIKQLCEEIIYDSSTFLDNSKEIAMNLFESMKKSENTTSCDLAICLYSIEDDYYIGLLLLDYKKTYTHSIEFVEDKFNIKIVENEVALPNSSQRLKRCAFIGLSGINDDYNLIILDKDLIKNLDLENYFVSSFLKCEIILDDKDKTRIFKNSAEKWVKTSLYDDIEAATIIRESLTQTLKDKEQINIKEFADKVIEEDNLRESFVEHISKEGIQEGNFNIDKKWVDKNLKNKVIKTDTGFEIKGSSEVFEDYFKYQTKKNDDGSIDIIIKNVKFYEEK